MSFSGSATCPRCTKTVYAAEQVMGPGRKFYHKPCLSCMTCKKRLDSFTLLEHDQEPYCKSCHAKNFGTHNISNRPAPAPDAFRTPPRTRTPLNGHGNGDRYTPDRDLHTPPPHANGTPSSPSIDSDEQLSSRAMAPVASRYASAAAVQRRHMTGDGNDLSPQALPRTLTGGGAPSPRRYGANNPACARCGKSVYFAEQVKAVGKTWHKSCLRCTAPACGTLLDSNRLRDHDGEPMCARCHSRLHGKGGLDK